MNLPYKKRRQVSNNEYWINLLRQKQVSYYKI